MTDQYSLHPNWKRAHAELLRLKKSRATLDVELGEWLLRALRAGAHGFLGFASFAEYVERLLGEKPRWTRERLRVAEVLEDLPLTRRELGAGKLNWSAARELVRVATPDTESEWLLAAKQCTARQLEELVSGRQPGDEPCDPADPHLRRHVLSFEVSGEVLATFREATAKLRRDADDPLSEEEALLLMARQVLAGSSDSGKSSYQIAVTVCEGCGRGFQQGSGDLIEVGPEIVAAAECDGEHVGPVSERANRVQAMSTTRPGTTPHVGRSAGHRRATRSIPPRIRREVVRRDAGRCVVPGCRHATYVDIHHLRPRAEGGDHDPTGLVVLCAAHHRALHRGRLLVEGDASSGLVFRHADGALYGRVESPAVAEVYQKAFVALRGLGFRETEARRTLDQVRRENDARDVESVLRRGLAVLAA